MRIVFDLDGTIADLYGVESWLPKLRAEDPSPYADARPLVNMSRLARHLNRLTNMGVEIAVTSWGSRESSDEYLEEVRITKIEWLRKHLPSVTFTEINVVAYGTPKSSLGGDILFDDEEKNRNEWKGESYSETEIFTVLKNLIKGLDR